MWPSGSFEDASADAPSSYSSRYSAARRSRASGSSALGRRSQGRPKLRPIEFVSKSGNPLDSLIDSSPHVARDFPVNEIYAAEVGRAIGGKSHLVGTLDGTPGSTFV